MANCFYCEREFTVFHYGTNRPLAFTKDHIIPLSKGGDNSNTNLVDCCTECNSFKGSLLLADLLLKAKDYFENKKRYKTIPHSCLCLIIKNAEILIANDSKNPNPEYPPIISKKRVKKSFYADAHLSVNANTFHSYKFNELAEKQALERILYLQSQTVEQFREARALKEKMIS